MLVELSSIKKTYPKSLALDGVSLKVTKGECIGLIGPNGSGKSSLFSIILGFTKPSSGSICVLGSTDPEIVRSSISAAPEHPGFLETLSGQENLELLCLLRGVDFQKISSLVNRLGLSQHLHKRVNSYSKGLRQRLTLCASLLANTELYLFDEPSVGLDPEGVVLLRELIGELKAQNKTIIISSHIISELEKVCTRFIVLYNGKVKLDAEIDKIEKQYSSVENAYLSTII